MVRIVRAGKITCISKSGIHPTAIPIYTKTLPLHVRKNVAEGFAEVAAVHGLETVLTAFLFELISAFGFEAEGFAEDFGIDNGTDEDIFLSEG